VSGPIVVTGASGFIGRALVARLNSQARFVIALGRAEFEAPGEAWQASVDGADCVIHLAARAHRGGDDSLFESDAQLARSVARAAAQRGVRRFIHMSSIGVLGTSTNGSPFTEQSAAAPKEPYARAKLRSEQAVRAELAAAPTDWVILRPTMVYGPDAPGNFARLLGAIRKGWPLPFASVRNRRHLIGIDNLVDAIELCVAHAGASRQVFVVADDEPVSTAELVRLIAQGLSVAPRLWPVPPALLQAAARASGRRRMAESLLGDLEIDCGHIRRTLGWAPRVPAREGIVQAARTHRP
jgi:nucleoside-diphosphate-sugar epimerase